MSFPIVILFRVILLSILWNLHIGQFGPQCRNIRQTFGRHSVHEVQQFYIGSFTVMGIIIIKSRETDISSLMSHSFDVVRATKCFWAFHIWEIKRKREGGEKKICIPFGYQFIPGAIKRKFFMSEMNKNGRIENNSFCATKHYYQNISLTVCWNVECGFVEISVS